MLDPVFSEPLKSYRMVACLLGLCLTAAPAMAAPRLAPVWTDHVVIQRDAPIRVTGKATPNERIVGVLGDQTSTVLAGPDGAFVLTFPARPASSAALTLTVTGTDATATVVRDIAIGDVWLCSGQSNMEFPVARALNGDAIAHGAADPGLRLLQIPKATASIPTADFASSVAWAAAAPASLPDFSAACYFMGRDLRAALGIPIGLIHASWGGSRLRPWLAPDAAEKLYGTAQMAMLRRYDIDPLGAVTAFSPTWTAWYRQESDGTQPWRDPDILQWSAVPQISDWNDWQGTPLQSNPIGTVWLRRTFDLTQAQASAGATLKIGILDDQDMTFVNGHPVGNTFSWDQERHYRVPPAFLHPGANEIMVAVSNSYDKGGFTTGKDRLWLTIAGGAAIPLPDGWRYSIAPVKSFPPRPPWDSNGGIGIMYNRMIAPLGNIPLRGAAWYQGESDTGVPGYAARLRALISGWRHRFGAGLRMLIVQLANYGQPQTTPAPSSWAVIRDDQRSVVASDDNAELASAIDIGERTDIHPANKALLGQRLALAAQGVAMPMPASATRESDGIRIHFTGVDKALATWSGPFPLGFELCGDEQGSCRYAKARVAGSDVLLAGDGAPASRVRYAWADNPVVNLYDARALPVPGFELPIAPVMVRAKAQKVPRTPTMN